MKQERKFSLAEVHTKMGTMGEVRLNQAFLDILGVKPGDFLVFTVSKEGGVTVKGEKQTTHTGGTTAPDTTIPRIPHPDQVTQVTLFSTEEPSKADTDEPKSAGYSMPINTNFWSTSCSSKVWTRATSLSGTAATTRALKKTGLVKSSGNRKTP